MKIEGNNRKRVLIAAVAVVSVALLLSSVFATDPPEQEEEQALHDYSVVYQPDGAKVDTGNSLVDAIALTGEYDGIISTEYNPEHWYDEDKQNLPRSTPGNLPSYDLASLYSNWVGPAYTATGIMKLTLTVANSTTYMISFPSAYTISVDKPAWVDSQDIDNDSGTHTWTFTTTSSGGGTQTVYVTLNFEANKVFGGWVIGNESKECKIVRTVDGNTVTWTYSKATGTPVTWVPYYRESYDTSGEVWTYQSSSDGVAWTSCSKSTDRYYMMNGTDFYLAGDALYGYTDGDPFYTDSFRKVENWTLTDAEKEKTSLGDNNYKDQFGNTWHKDGGDYVATEYRVFAERQYLPGDIVPNTTKALISNWIEPDVYTKQKEISSWGSNAGKKTASITAPGDLPHAYLTATRDSSSVIGLTSTSYQNDADPTDDRGVVVQRSGNSSETYDVRYGNGRHAQSMYGSIYLLTNMTYYMGVGTGMPAGTYRSADFSNKAIFQHAGKDSASTISGNVIIENTKIRGNGDPGAIHGSGKGALYGCGNILIMGVGLQSVNNYVRQNNTYRDFQVYGGSVSGSITTKVDADLSTAEVDKKYMVFNTADDNVSVDIGTCLIVHSGCYYNVIAGNNSGSIGASGAGGVKLSTYLVMKGGIVGDTVIGASSGQGSNVFSNIDNDPVNHPYNKWTGGTFVYLTGAFMPGDDWVDLQTGDNEAGSLRKTNFNLVDVSVINGASTKGTLEGTSHVFVTDHTSVYDVTAAGREKTSFTKYSYLEISGQATVRHAACGGVMNGMNDYNHLVDNTYVSIQGDCKIANVYGSGYDIYDKPDGSSMKNGGTITVEMRGGTVNSIYGGGYRGSIGDSTIDISKGIYGYDKLNITINVTGGHILDSVYGGGSGGVDKAKHYNNGTRYNDNAGGFADPVGKSYVYGNITVNISGGEIDGSVYGGGKSVPALKSYKGANSFNAPSITNLVAMTYGHTYVNVTGGTIGGSVYGGGRGVEWEYNKTAGTFQVTDTTRTILMRSDGVLNPIDWYEASGSNPITFYTTEKTQNTYFINYLNGAYTGVYLDYARMTGDAYVKITGGEIQHSVYGGGSNGRILGVLSDSRINGSSNVEITGGRIGENVFGGGLGIEGVVAVTGSRNVMIDMATADMNSENPADIIYGSIYGGSSVGDDGPYNGKNVVSDDISKGFPDTESRYATYIATYAVSDSTVIIKQALIGNPYNGGTGNSVFGGGFMGKTYGYTHVYVGYGYVRAVDEKGAYTGVVTPSPYNGSEVKTIFLNSIYAGGDISTDSNGGVASGITPFDPDKPLVLGGGSVQIYGNGDRGNTKILGCIMGSGNSCNTKWTTSVNIESLINKGKMTGIHRTNTLTISQSILDILSRSTVTEVAGSSSKDLSLFMIDDLTMKNDSTVTVSAPMDYIASFHSISKDNTPTTLTSPSNTLVYTTGVTLYVRDSGLQYGSVEGYTALEILGQGDFGAYVMGDTLSSTGGFVVTKEGTYKEADYSFLGSNIKCWFIAGTQNKVVTMNMSYDKTNPNAVVDASLDIVKMQTGTKMRYTGATFTTISTDNSGNNFEFVRPGTEDASYKFGMIIGYSASSNPGDNLLYADTERYLSIGGAASAWVTGTYYSDDPAESRGSYEPMKNEESSSARQLIPLSPVDMKTKNQQSAAGTYKFNLRFTGVPENTTMYVGYLIINLQEVDEVTYEAMDEDGNMVLHSNTMVTGNVNIRVDLYVIGSGDVMQRSEYKVVLKADEDNDTHKLDGYTEIIIPTGFIMGRLVLSSVETENVPSGESIKIAAVINQDSTTGWMTVNNPVTWTQNGQNGENQPIGTMSGTIVATIRYSIEGFTPPNDLEEGEYPKFILHFVTTDKNNAKVASDVSVTIRTKPIHTVAFVNEMSGVTTYGYYSDGTYLSASQFTNMGSNFIGWYLDNDFNNMFDYKMPITRDMALYARFSFIVTFDNMNGTSSRMYVASDRGGALLTENNVPKPIYAGYDFKGWYKDPECIVPWDYSYDSINGDVRLYAKWMGTEVRVNFYYYKDGNWLLYKGGGPYETSSEEERYEREVPQDVTDAYCLTTVNSTTKKDMFGNTYTGESPSYTLSVKSLYGPGEREYKYVVTEDKYYVKIDSEWQEVTDETYLEDLRTFTGYSFKYVRGTNPQLSYYKQIDSDNYRKIYGTLVRPVVSDGYDQFGNHYTAGVMDYKIVWTSDLANGGGMYKYVISEGKYYRNTGNITSPVWAAMEGSLSSYYIRDNYANNYDYQNGFAKSAKYLEYDGGLYMMLSEMRVISPDVVNYVDQFGNEYASINGSNRVSVYHFYRTELELKYEGGQYYERVGTDAGWVSYTGATTGLYYKDTYGYHFKHDDVEGKYVPAYLSSGDPANTYPDSYVMAWIDHVPYYPTVRYGSNFSTIDPTLSTSENPVNILDGAQAGVQALLGDDKFIRWQAYSMNDPYSTTSTGVYSDTVLTSSLVDLSDLSWQTGMPEINLYAVTAKVAINLIMDKNVNDASAVVSAPNTFLVYPTPTYIYDTGETFSKDCESVVPTDGREKYTDGDGTFFYKVLGETNQYVTEDGRTLYTYDSTYGYYGMKELNYYEEYTPEDAEEGKTYYKDRYGNVYEGGKTMADIIERRIFTENTAGDKYRIIVATNDFQIWDGDKWVACDPVTDYYYMDANGTKYVKTDTTKYRMVDWGAVEIEYSGPDGSGKYTDTLGMDTRWTYADDKYTLVSLESVYKSDSQEGYIYRAERTETAVPDTAFVQITWTYYYSADAGENWTRFYTEFYNPQAGVWIYKMIDGVTETPCSRITDFFLRDSSDNEYTRFDDCKFGKHAWTIVDADITFDRVEDEKNIYKDQFGNEYTDGTEPDEKVLVSSIVWLFEQEYASRKNVVSSTVTEWIVTSIFGAEEFNAYKEVDEKVSNDAGESLHYENKLYTWTGSAWSAQETFQESYIEYTNGNIYRELRRYLAIGGPAEWLAVYTESYDASQDKWTYWYRSGEYSEHPFVLFYYKDAYDNHYITHDNATYKCVYGSEMYYSFSFTLNEATRNGYKLSGWHNTHVNIDDALYPTSGIDRTIKLFYHEVDGKTVINKEVLETTNVLGLPVTFINVDYDMYEAENPEYAYAGYQGKSLPRLDDAIKSYNITYLARWSPMSYTVTISEPAVGEVDAFLVKSDGTREAISGSTQAKYGDRVEISYSGSGVYQFDRWIAAGECDVENITSSSTTLVVRGNCSVSANEIGERLVSLTFRFDAHELSESDIPHVTVWLENSLTGDRYQLQRVDQSGDYEIFRGYVPLNSSDPNEEYYVFVKYDDEEYQMRLLPGELRITKDSTTDHIIEVISARIRQSIQIEEEVYMYSSVNGVHLPEDKQVQIKVGNNVVVSVTRYVGVTHEYLENNRDIINNPYNGVPPVRITIAQGYDYLTLEGFPDEDEHGHYIFNINTEHNYHKGHSYTETTETFDLNWTRTDAPAEIIIQMTERLGPAYGIQFTIGNPESGWNPRDYNYYNYDDKLVLGGNLQSQIDDAVADKMGAYLAERGKSIQGWYYDKEFTKPVPFGAIVDSEVVSMLELNRDPSPPAIDTGYYLYAKVVDTADMATVTVKIYQQNADGTWPSEPTVANYPLNIVNNGSAYIGTVPLDEIQGFHMERTGTKAPAYTGMPEDAAGTGTFTLIDNVVTSYSLSVTYGGVVKTGGVLNLYYARNTVTLQLNKTALESYKAGETPWEDDCKTVLVGSTQELPILIKGIEASGWTSSPSKTIEKVGTHFQYEVGLNESGTVFLTALYEYTDPVTVTFITSKGYYDDSNQSRITITLNRNTAVPALPGLTLPEGYTLNTTDPYPGLTVGTTLITEDMSFRANLDIVKHNFTFRADNGIHAQVSAINDSSDLLTAGSSNALEHHSEISIIVKPAKGRTIAVNETKDWAYIKQSNGVPVGPEYTSISEPGVTHRDQFYNRYNYDGDNYNLVYSLVWVYNTTENQAHTAGDYVCYILDASTGRFYLNTGDKDAPVRGAEHTAFECYYYKDGGLETGNDYVKSDDQFQRMDWVHFEDLGTPTKLSDDRGYLWVFFLDRDTDIVIHTTEMSVNINFVVNGSLITNSPNEHMRVWGTGDKSSTSYLLGNNIPMYDKVEFFGYSDASSDERHYSNTYWYKDRACTEEYPYTIVTIEGVDYHRYEYLATEDLTVYTMRGKVNVNLYNYDGTVYRGYLLDRSGDPETLNCITLPDLKYILDGHVFVGWAEYNESTGKKEYMYGPMETFNPVGDRLTLYAYYLKGGASEQVSYDGMAHSVEITPDSSYSQAIGDTVHVRYSDTGPISSLVEGVSSLEYEDFTDTTVYYYGEITSSKTGLRSSFSGSFHFAVAQIELYIIAPSRSYAESYDINGVPVEHVVNSGSIQMIATTSNGKVPNSEDIVAVVLDTVMYGYSDRIAGVGSVRTAASIYFAEGKAENYIVHYVDGSLIVYPLESARYMYGGGL